MNEVIGLPVDRNTANVIGDGLSNTGTIIQARDIASVKFDLYPAEQAVIPQQLPPGDPYFSGRRSELRRLTVGLHTTQNAASPSPTIAVLTGSGGVGKTALAVQWAHSISGGFPDGQLFFNLRGFDRAGVPVRPDDVLAFFLTSLGKPPEKIPATLEQKSALFRTTVARLRVLILLDNAYNAAQVRDIIPNGPGCLVIVTSRESLAGLLGARRVDLNPFSPAEALTLLRRCVGARVDADPGGSAELCELCSGLPLALRIVGQHLTVRPRVTIAQINSMLLREKFLLSKLSLPNDEIYDVRAVFSWSLRWLRPPGLLLYRLLGLHAGPDICLDAAVALTCMKPQEADLAFQEIVNANLITESGDGRYKFHDLLKRYAEECAILEGDDAFNRAAVHRLLNWYLTMAIAADRIISPHRANPIESHEATEASPAFSAQADAVEWLNTEHQNLVAATKTATQWEEFEIAWQLPSALVGYFALRNQWPDWIFTHHIAVAAAERTGDRAALARTTNNLSAAYFDSRQFGTSAEYFTKAISVAEELGDDKLRSLILPGYGSALLVSRRFEEAADKYKQAILLLRTVGNRVAEAVILKWLAETYREMNRYEDSIIAAQESYKILRDAEYDDAAAESLLTLGSAFNCDKQYVEALSCLNNARQTFRMNSLSRQEGLALFQIGLSRKGIGDIEAANECFREAMSMLDQSGDEYNAALVLARRGEVSMVHGSKEEGIALIRQALDVLEKYEDAQARYEANSFRQVLLGGERG
jgi:tetratricopeptide (TPR) repeat protein